MDFYFTDRKYNLLGIASTDPDLNSDIVGIGDIAGNSGEYQSIAGGYRSYSGTVYFDETAAEHVEEMCAFGNFVLYKDRSGKSVWLTILTSRYDPLTGTDEITAEDASLDLINGTVTAYKATTPMAITDYVGLFAADSGFEIGVNEVPSYKRQLEWDSDDSSILTRLLSVATQFDVEINFRFEVDGLSVVHKYIDFRKRIGDDNGITLYTNVSLNKIVTTTDGADLCTSIVGTGATPEGANQPISLKGYSWNDPDGRFVLDKDGVLRDPVALRTWSRLLSATNPAPTSAHIVRHKTYEAATQATLLQSVLADLKKYNHPAVNYEVDIAVLPENVHIGDTITLVNEAERLNLSARVLELRYSYSESQGTAVLGDYLLLADQVDPELRDLANSLKQAGKLHQYWPWTRYADDDTGNGISALPAGKAYMAVVWNDQSAVPSDDPADYSGKWQKVKGDTGVGEAGPKGDDGKTSYFHTAYADTVSGDGFSQSPAGKSYIGTYSDFTEADSTTASAYTWALIKGAKGDTGPSGKDITSYDSGMVLPDTVAPKNSQFWVVDKDGIITAFYKSDGTKWVSQEISASAINAATFNGLEFNGVNFNGSNFVSRFTSQPLEDSRLTADDDNTDYIDKGTGTAKLADGYLTIEGTVDGSSTQTFHVETGPSGISSEIRDTNLLVAGSLSKGVLTLAYKDDASSHQGTIDAQTLEQIGNVDRLLWEGTLVMNSVQTVTPSLSIDQCLHGWMLLWSQASNGSPVNSRFIYQPILKSFAVNHSGQGLTFPIAAPVDGITPWGNNVAKYVYANATTIYGYSSNNQGTSYGYALREVRAF